MKIGVGIVGFGLSGAVFHNSLIEQSGLFEVRGMVTSKDVPLAVPTLEKLLTVRGIDLVIVATPNFRHFEDAWAALEAGKHVVIEKPFVTSPSEGEKLIALAKKKNLVLSVFHNRRWDSDFLTVRDLMASGELGRVVHFESHFDRYRPEVDTRWKEKAEPGTGSLWDLGSHLIDQALMLFGKPQEIFADVTAQREGAAADDYFHLIFKYDRTRVLLHGGSLVLERPPRFQIHGTLGSFVKYGLDTQEDELKGIASQEKDGTLSLSNGEKKLLPTRSGSYRTYYSELFQAIQSGGKAPVTAEEALEVVRIITQCAAARVH